MNFQVLLALLARIIPDLERDEAEALADLLSKSVQPSSFKEAERVVNEIVTEVKSKKKK